MEQAAIMELIASLRASRGFSQKEFAAKLGIASNTYRNIESGYANLRVLDLSLMLKALGLNWNDLAIYLEGEKKNGRLG